MILLVALAWPPTALAHKERPAVFPDDAKGSVPVYRTTGPALVVCKPDSAERIARLPAAARTRNLALLPQCRFAHIQAAVDAAVNGTRILILPGVYREEPSRASPSPDPACNALQVAPASGPGLVAGYEYQRRCPNDQNLIAIVGDSNGDGVCDSKCNLQLEGTGSLVSDVLIDGDRRKLNAIRGDRADGLYLRNFTVQLSDFNNIYVIETNGFRFDRIVSRWSREYGFLSFVSDNGIYEHLVAHGNGDGGIYPGSGPEGACLRYGIEIRDVEAYGNLLGYSGTAGNGIWVHDSRFHHNTTGIVMDSAFAGHPGMPQDCARFERNRIWSNNLDLHSATRDAYCRRPILERNPRVPCPAVGAPIGVGVLILGGNRNLFRSNSIWDNWRRGVQLAWVPAFNRGETDPEKAFDTSNGNRFVGNRMGVTPEGNRAPNGVDFWWDEEGVGNCWQGNTGWRGRPVTGDPKRLPSCPNTAPFRKANPQKFFELVRCGAWKRANPDPADCPWVVPPRQPR